MSFHCPQCDGLTRVIGTRAELRQRRCKSCSYKFVTEEAEFDGPMLWPSQQRPAGYYRAYRKRKAMEALSS